MSDDRSERRKHFAELAKQYGGDLAPLGTIEIGFMLQDFLENMVADADTHVDKGFGCGSFDLWVKMGGREYYVEIKESALCASNITAPESPANG